jgi:hypothetical protein
MKRFIYLSLVAFISILSFECCNSNTEIIISKTFQAKDSANYKLVKGKFYTNKFGKLFEQKQFAKKGKGDVYDSQIYFDSVVILKIGDSIIEKSLSEIIDIGTYVEFDNGTSFSKDKNNVYYSFVNTGGGYRTIVNSANPNTFKPLSDYQYGMDDKHIFFQSKMIEGLNFKKHEILYTLDTTDFFIDYIKDNKVVFYRGDTVKGADAKTFKLINNQKWSAEDKNYKYECCGQRIK